MDMCFSLVFKRSAKANGEGEVGASCSTSAAVVNGFLFVTTRRTNNCFVRSTLLQAYARSVTL